MATIKIHGASAVVTSGVKVEILETLRKFKPTALKLVDPETKDEIFGVSVGTNPSFTNHGVVFTGKNAEGAAQVTLPLPATLEDAKKKEYVRDNFGYALLNLNRLEEQIIDIMDETEIEFVAIEEGIETI